MLSQLLIIGTITMKNILSEMPLLKLELYDKSYFGISGKFSGKTIEIDDFKFHNCINNN